MKVLVLLLALVGVSSALNIDRAPIDSPVYGYMTKYGIPEAERILRQEDELLKSGSKIVGGAPATIEDNPWQAGLLVNITGTTGRSACGASLLSGTKLVTAAHCWFDGRNQGLFITVVLGSNFLFYDGERIGTQEVILHPEWSPSAVRNDVAVITLPQPVAMSNMISPIALPSGADLSNSFQGEDVRASGFGRIKDGAPIGADQFLSQVDLVVISNTVCMFSFPINVRSTNICTRGAGGVGPCNGDSGGPLVARINTAPVLVGLTSFGSGAGCQNNLPAVYARVTSFIDFITSNL